MSDAGTSAGWDALSTERSFREHPAAVTVAGHVLEIAILAAFLALLCSRSFESPYLLVGGIRQTFDPLTRAWIFLGLPAVIGLGVLAACRARRFLLSYGGLVLAAGCVVLLVILCRGTVRTLSPSPLNFDPYAWMTLVLMLAVSRPFRKPVVCGLVLTVLVAAIHGLTFWVSTSPAIHEVRLSMSGGAIDQRMGLTPGILVSTILMSLSPVLGALLPYLLALYAVRHGFAWWRYLLSGALGWWVVAGTLHQRLPFEDGDMFQGAVFLGVLLLLARLPLQRRWAETMVGVPFASDSPLPGAASPGLAASSSLAHAMVALLALLWLAFAVAGHYERRMETVGRVVEPPRYSPALVNAFDFLQEHFVKPEGKQRTSDFLLQDEARDELNVLSQLNRTPPALLDEVYRTMDMVEVERGFGALQPGFDAFVRAADADYCCFYDKDHAVIASFINLRAVSQGLAARARLRICQKRPAEALDDIETLLKVAWILNDDPSGFFVHHMIAATIRGQALSAAEDYFFYSRQNVSDLDLLGRMLERNARKVRIDFPSEKIRRIEPGFWPVVPHFDVTVPGVTRAGQSFYRKWAQFDHLVIGVALEAYRRDQGHYPDSLEALAPKYLARVPREPVEGGAYRYENLGDDVRLDIPASLGKDVSGLLPAPRENPATRALLDKYGLARTEKASGQRNATQP